MSMIPIVRPDYSDGRTKQAFKDDTDINKILQRAQKTGTISHLSKYKAVYGDYADYDFFENLQKITSGQQIFDALPSEIRREFDQNPGDFFNYVNDPTNADRLPELLPGLAAPGRQRLDVSGKTAPAVASEPQANANPSPNTQPEGTPSNAPTGASSVPEPSA